MGKHTAYYIIEARFLTITKHGIVKMSDCASPVVIGEDEEKVTRFFNENYKAVTIKDQTFYIDNTKDSDGLEEMLSKQEFGITVFEMSTVVMLKL